MADVHAAIRSALTADATLVALVGARIRWVRLEHDETMPAVVLTLAPGSDQWGMGTKPTHRWNMFQIDSYGDTLSSAIAVDAAVEGAINGYSGTSETVVVQHVELEPPGDAGYEDAGELYRIMRRGTIKYDI